MAIKYLKLNMKRKKEREEEKYNKNLIDKDRYKSRIDIDSKLTFIAIPFKSELITNLILLDLPTRKQFNRREYPTSMR